MGKKSMATPTKRLPNNCKYALEDSIAITKQGARQVRLYHQEANDAKYCHQLMELLGIFTELENKIKSIGIEREE